uniref:Uncharacterized protein n=1 Tax=Arundo donax TaxID=35708 RepID=A0A0A9CAJ0_ARUDO
MTRFSRDPTVFKSTGKEQKL